MRWLTAGESHGQALSAIVEGIPASVSITTADIDYHLQRRRLGVGRGARQNFEADKVTILGGVRLGLTQGGPIAIQVGNSEWPKWEKVMSADPVPLDDIKDGFDSIGNFFKGVGLFFKWLFVDFFKWVFMDFLNPYYILHDIVRGILSVLRVIILGVLDGISGVMRSLVNLVFEPIVSSFWGYNPSENEINPNDKTDAAKCAKGKKCFEQPDTNVALDGDKMILISSVVKSGNCIFNNSSLHAKRVELS